MSEPEEVDAPDDGMEPDAPDLTVEGNGKSRERSQIKFPYTDIEDAVTVARTIKNVHGARPIALDQLATALGGTSTKSGAFRTKLATASTFGAVKGARGMVELTELGHRLADEHSRPAALAEAFLHVPLYQKVYARYQGQQLPEDAGLESDIRDLGVVASQADRARQAMQRSAEKAGFFWGGRSRLVMPTDAKIGPPASAEPATPPQDPPPGPQGSHGSGAEGSPMSNPLLSALFSRMLPPEGEPFPAAERRRLIRALAVNLDVIYGDESVITDIGELAKVFQDRP